MTKPSFNKTGGKVGIGRRTISRWQKNKDLILNASNKRNSFRLKSGIDRSFCPSMETELKKWINEKREQGSCLDSFAIKQKALELFNNIKKDDSTYIDISFASSNGWFRRFCQR